MQDSTGTVCSDEAHCDRIGLPAGVYQQGQLTLQAARVANLKPGWVSKFAAI
jgi:hypothetical protein